MSERPSTIRSLSCPQCGGTLALRAAGSSVSMICEHCGSTLDATDPDLRLIQAASEALDKPPIPIGRRGLIRRVQWEVVGYLVRRSDDGTQWSEYLLFNPYLGYSFLVDDGRRFHHGRLIDRLPEVDGGTATFEGSAYRETESGYWAEVTFVVGEFYWRVAVGERVYVTDFARHGAMLSDERTDSEQTWTKLDLLNFGEAERAFGQKQRREYSFSARPSPDEDSPWRGKLWEAIFIAIAACLAVLFVNAFGNSPERAAASEEHVVLDGPEATFVLRDIDVASPHSRVSVTVDGTVLANAWIDLDYSLVNQKTQVSYDAYGLAERYNGTDSDGPWTEGDNQPEIRFASVPRGRYDLVITASAHRWQGSSPSYSYYGTSETVAAAADTRLPISFVVRTGGTFIENFWLAIVMILIWPSWLGFRHYMFEQTRKGGL